MPPADGRSLCSSAAFQTHGRFHSDREPRTLCGKGEKNSSFSTWTGRSEREADRQTDRQRERERRRIRGRMGPLDHIRALSPPTTHTWNVHNESVTSKAHRPAHCGEKGDEFHLGTRVSTKFSGLPNHQESQVEPEEEMQSTDDGIQALIIHVEGHLLLTAPLPRNTLPRPDTNTNTSIPGPNPARY